MTRYNEDMHEHLDEMFDYDLWANLKWLRFLKSVDATAEEWAQLNHILGAQQIWFARIVGLSPTGFSGDEATSERFEKVHRDWKAAVNGRDLDQEISYHRFNGDAHTQTLKQIANHVLNHGTYHRGSLRGLLSARGNTDFPETDLLGFYIEKK